MSRPRGGSATLQEVTDGQGKPAEDTAGTAAAPPPPAPVELPVLPREKTTATGVLESKTVLIHGPAGIGKSTLASEWAGGDMFFFDTAGELEDLSVYKLPVTSWESFRLTAASYVEEMTGKKPLFKGAVIDTADVWAMYCAQSQRAKLGVAHESDAEWGKGWTLVREELQGRLAKLQALPGGLILISHTKEVEIKPKRQPAYTRMIPTLAGGVREVVVNAADLVLFVDWADDGENRVIYTKPDATYEAKERARVPRLPAQIVWPFGVSGWEILKEAWDG